MSTPAAAVLDSAPAGNPGSGPTPTSAAPAVAPGTAPPAANQAAFWNSWNLPDQQETKQWVANKNYDSPFTLAKTAQQLEREAATLRQAKGYPTDKVGADGKVTRDEAAWKAWAAATGVPESADKYDIPVPEANPYPQFKQFMAEEFHKAGVPAAMATQLAKGYESAVGKMEAQVREQENAASAQGLKELELAWGANYQERVQLASRGKAWLAQEVGGMSDAQMRTLEAVLGTPKFLSAMWKIGAGNGEARFAGGDNPPAFTGGASEAQARLDQIQSQRSAGTIKDHQWRELDKPGGELEQLRNRIAAGFATMQ